MAFAVPTAEKHTHTPKIGGKTSVEKFREKHLFLREFFCALFGEQLFAWRPG